MFKDGAEASLTRAQRILHLLGRGDIAPNAYQPDDLARRIAERELACAQPEPPSLLIDQ